MSRDCSLCLLYYRVLFNNTEYTFNNTEYYLILILKLLTCPKRGFRFKEEIFRKKCKIGWRTWWNKDHKTLQSSRLQPMLVILLTLPTLAQTVQDCME